MPNKKVQKAKKTIDNTDKKIPKIRVATLNENKLNKKGIGQTKGCGCQKCPCPCDDQLPCLCEPVPPPCKCDIQCKCVFNTPEPKPCPNDGCKTDTCGCQGYCPSVKHQSGNKPQGGSQTFFKIAGDKDIK